MMGVLGSVELFDNGAFLWELMSAQRILSRESFQKYLELSIELFKTHVIGVNTSNSLDMLMIMARVGKTNRSEERRVGKD